MAKCGTASQVTGSYVEFQAAVLRALPRDIDSEVALEWVNSGERLARVLHETLVCPTPNQSVAPYPITVDYERSVEEAVGAGRYDWINSDINSERFSTERKGVADIEVNLIHFDKTISTKDAMRELDKLGRPAEIYELLAFGEKYPDVQREFPVVALGSVWQDSDGYRLVPCLRRRGSERGLDLDWVENDWNEICRFAAVRNSLHFPPPIEVGFSLLNCRYQPPSILPTSLIFSETRINFLLSRAFISHAICRKNFSKSSFTTAFCTYDSFWLL